MAKANNGAPSASRQERFPVELIRQHVAYDPEAGAFTLLVATPRRPAGARIDAIHPSSGYRMIRLLGAYHLCQRVAWALMTGEWPDGILDFANGDRSDCRWSNLKAASHNGGRLDRDGLMAALDYDPSTGLFTWRLRADKATNWNTRWAGKLAGGYDKDGYHVIVVNGFGYKAHRLAVLFMTGEWPPEDVDHADLDAGNNRWGNLRLATRTDNNGNRAMTGNAASGFKGVYLIPSTGRWYSKIQRNDVGEYLGTFDTREEAHAAYVRAAERLYGEFARAG